MLAKCVHVIRKKSRQEHRWVFSNETRRIEGEPRPGDTVLVYEGGRLLGSGFYNPNSLIQIRLYSKQPEEFDLEFIKQKITKAYQ